MQNDAKEADKATDDVPTDPLVHVDVSGETARKAARFADEHDIALEDALARLTVFNYPPGDVWQVIPEGQAEPGSS